MLASKALLFLERKLPLVLSARSLKKPGGQLGAVAVGGGVSFFPEHAGSSRRGPQVEQQRGVVASIGASEHQETIYNAEELEEEFELEHAAAARNAAVQYGGPHGDALKKGSGGFLGTPDGDADAHSESSAHASVHLNSVGNLSTSAGEVYRSSAVEDERTREEGSKQSTTDGAVVSSGAGKSVEAYRFLLRHIDAEIAALKRRHSSVSAHRGQLEDQHVSRIRELYHLMDSPWLLLQPATASPLPVSGVSVYLKEQMELKRGSPGETIDISRDKVLALATEKNYFSLAPADRKPYEEAAHYNAVLREEMKRRLSDGCSQFEQFCEQVKECTAEMVRTGTVPPFPKGTVVPPQSRLGGLHTPPPGRPSASPTPSPARPPALGARVMSRGKIRCQHHPNPALAAGPAPASRGPHASLSSSGTPTLEGKRVTLSKAERQVRAVALQKLRGVPGVARPSMLATALQQPHDSAATRRLPGEKDAARREGQGKPKFRPPSRRILRRAPKKTVKSGKSASRVTPRASKPVKKAHKSSTNDAKRRRGAAIKLERAGRATPKCRTYALPMLTRATSAALAFHAKKKSAASRSKRGGHARRLPTAGSVIVLSERSPSLPLPSVSSRSSTTRGKKVSSKASKRSGAALRSRR